MRLKKALSLKISHCRQLIFITKLSGACVRCLLKYPIAPQTVSGSLYKYAKITHHMHRQKFMFYMLHVPM